VLGVREIVPPPLPQRRRLAFVPAAEDRHLAAAVAQRAGEHFDHGGLSRAADGEIADDHDEAAERGVVQNAVTIKPQPELHDAAEKIRAQLQEPREDRGCGPFPFPEDNVDAELLKFVELLTDPAIGHDGEWL
jgi:hypothetical protein